MTHPKPAKRWLAAQKITPDIDRALANYDPITRQLLFNRNLYTAAAAASYFNATTPFDDDPLQIAGMGETLERIERALTAQEEIAIYGDYDTDGVTATAVLVQVLTALGARVRAYIPNRFDEGYGLNNAALTELKESGVSLVVTVDCGIRSFAETDHAKKIGLDLIISDHHHVGTSLPNAFAVINPKREDDPYPEKGLAGVGLAYKIAQALVRQRNPQPINGADVLDLVALGTVADLAPLMGENRRLVRDGLKVLNKAKRQGILSLMEVAKVKRGAVDAGAIGFTLGPRLNAAGRLESALASYQLLITNNVFDANQLAAQLNVQNRDRQTLTKKIAQEAKDIALRAGDVPFLFAAHKDFNSGVVGLAAARLCEEFYRPAIVAQIGESETKGSARSIKEFHVTEALDACADLLVRYGGHAAAAGFTIANDKVELFAERLRNYAAEKLKGQNLQPALRYDLNVQLSEWTTELTQELKLFEPCGYGNPSPVFTAHDLEVRYPQQIGAEGLHLRMQLCEGEHKMQAVAFRQGAWATNMPKRVDVLYALEWNEWNGEKRLQMNVKDIKGSGS